MENRIVLGFPYAGAFQWLLSAEESFNKSIKDHYDGSHPYYKTLYGKNHNLIIDETVSLTLLFDEIYLSPVDSYLPDRDKYYIGEAYSNQEWGIYTNWEWEREIEDLHRQISVLLSDAVVLQYLKKVPKVSRIQIVQEALNQIHISYKFDTAIFAIPSYLKLCERINDIINSTSTLKTQSSIIPKKAFHKVFDISSLHFTINSLEEFALLKKDTNVRNYGESFRHYIKRLPNGDLDESFLYEAMNEAINIDNIADKISGGLGLTSTITGVISLIPVVGTVTGLVGLGADVSSRIAHGQSDENKWWLLAPEISKKLSKKRIEFLYKKSKGNH